MNIDKIRQDIFCIIQLHYENYHSMCFEQLNLFGDFTILLTRRTDKNSNHQKTNECISMFTRIKNFEAMYWQKFNHRDVFLSTAAGWLPRVLSQWSNDEDYIKWMLHKCTEVTTH